MFYTWRKHFICGLNVLNSGKSFTHGGNVSCLGKIFFYAANNVYTGTWRRYFIHGEKKFYMWMQRFVHGENVLCVEKMFYTWRKCFFTYKTFSPYIIYIWRKCFICGENVIVLYVEQNCIHGEYFYMWRKCFRHGKINVLDMEKMFSYMEKMFL